MPGLTAGYAGKLQETLLPRDPGFHSSAGHSSSFPAYVGLIQPRSWWEALGMSARHGAVPGRAGPAAQVKDRALPQSWSPPAVHGVPCLDRRCAGSTGSPLPGQGTCPGHCKRGSCNYGPSVPGPEPRQEPLQGVAHLPEHGETKPWLCQHLLHPSCSP